TCLGGSTLCDAFCVDSANDPANCGGCGTTCASGEVCSLGTCGVTCLGGATLCDASCVDTANDPANCGGCGEACASGEVCSMGTCGVTCLGGATLCGSSCVDTVNDATNCGGCGVTCAAGESCVSGSCGVRCAGGSMLCGSSCVDTANDAANCGGCGVACASGEVCSMGTCGLTCLGGTTMCGAECVDVDHDPSHCGACGAACGPREACVAATCTPLASTCDGFVAPDGTTVPGWTERTGDFLIDTERLYSNASGPAYANHVTMDGTVQADGCATMDTSYGSGTSLRSLGIVLRWAAADRYVVALIQDNSSSGTFNSMWIYEYRPGLTHLAGPGTGVSLGTNPIIRASVTGTTVLLEVDVDRDGTYDETLTGTTSITAPGLTGAMSLAFGTPGYIEEFCPSCP
ncbi:MAG: hypothetical protein RLO52_05605, partial [Sandaracinaceae bacterium]